MKIQRSSYPLGCFIFSSIILRLGASRSDRRGAPQLPSLITAGHSLSCFLLTPRPIMIDCSAREHWTLLRHLCAHPLAYCCNRHRAYEDIFYCLIASALRASVITAGSGEPTRFNRESSIADPYLVRRKKRTFEKARALQPIAVAGILHVPACVVHAPLGTLDFASQQVASSICGDSPLAVL